MDLKKNPARFQLENKSAQLGLITNVCASIDRQDCRRKMYVREKMELDSSFQLDSIDLFKERNLEIFRNDTILLR